MNAFTKLFRKGQTPQNQAIPGSSQVMNSAGGYSFAVDEWTQFERFLILGTDGGTYYATERTLTLDNAKVVSRCLDLDPARAVALTVAISDSGRAPKNAPSVFALAVAAGTGHLRVVAELDALRQVCRTPTDLFAFAAIVQSLRGWGSGLRRLVASWYAGHDPERLGFLVTKYAQRDGWTHRDLFRLVHPQAPSAEHQAVYRWVIAGSSRLSDRTVARRSTAPVSGAAIVTPPATLATRTREYPAVRGLPASILAFEAAQAAPDVATVVRLIGEHGLNREHVPSRWLDEPAVWEALLARMPATALIRNLGKMTSVGLLKPLSSAAQVVVDRLGDGDWLRRSRLHPMAILLAASVYGRGKGIKGKLTWEPVPQVVAALDAAFYRAFAAVTPTGKRRLLAIDVSGSMDGSMAAGTALSCREAAAALALIVAKTEPGAHIVGFASGGASGFGGQWGGGDPKLVSMNLSAVSTVAGAVAAARAIPMGGTDCSLPMRVALKEKWDVDSFEVYTDNETWAGPVHPIQALKTYRNQTGIAAKLVVQAFTATPFTIADPTDAGCLDVVGLDAASPGLVADFIRS